jgi:quercetin dioxygenase-like cupin family protein
MAINTETYKKVSEPWGESLKIFENKQKHFVVGLFTVTPNKSMQIHTHDEADELIYVLEGKASYLVGKQEAELNQGSAILVPKKIEHKFFNNGSEKYKCLYIVGQIK